VACSSSSAIGSKRSAGGAHDAWLERGTRLRASRPKAAPAEGRELPLVELPWSVDQATAKMLELAKCPPPAEAPAEG